jgi:SAM-dependent methyltransferase
VLGPEYGLIERTISSEDGERRAEDVLRDFRVSPGLQILDLGCGDGRAVDLLADLEKPHYTGVDIERSPEVSSRTRTDADFLTYDGETLPFPDCTFEVVYSRQVFEHIRHPDRVVSEVRRVLKPGGAFIGSLSYLEPYHSYSIFNTTPYGLFRLVEDNGLTLQRMWPACEGLILLVRQIPNRKIAWFRLVFPMIEVVGLPCPMEPAEAKLPQASICGPERFPRGIAWRFVLSCI